MQGIHLLDSNLIVKTSIPAAPGNVPLPKDITPDPETAGRSQCSVPLTFSHPVGVSLQGTILTPWSHSWLAAALAEGTGAAHHRLAFSQLPGP